MIDRTIFCEVRRWNGDPRGPFFSIRLTGTLITEPVEVPLVYGTNVQHAVNRELCKLGLLGEGQLMGEANLKMATIIDNEVTRRRMLHGYGVGNL